MTELAFNNTLKAIRDKYANKKNHAPNWSLYVFQMKNELLQDLIKESIDYLKEVYKYSGDQVRRDFDRLDLDENSKSIVKTQLYEQGIKF